MIVNEKRKKMSTRTSLDDQRINEILGTLYDDEILDLMNDESIMPDRKRH